MALSGPLYDLDKIALEVVAQRTAVDACGVVSVTHTCERCGEDCDCALGDVNIDDCDHDCDDDDIIDDTDDDEGDA